MAEGFVTDERAAELREQSRELTDVVLEPRQLDAFELLATGALAPLDRFVLDADDGPVLDVADQTVTGPVALRDPEGLLLAVLEPEARGAGADGTIRLGGRPEVLALPPRYDHADLRRTPAAVRAGADDGERPALLLDRPLLAAEERWLAARPGGVLLVLAAGGSDPTDARHHAVIRALRASAAALGPDSDLVLSPVDPADLDRYGAALAAAYGASERLDPTSLDGVDEQRRRLAAGLDGGAPLPVDLLSTGVADALRPAFPDRAEAGLTVFFTGLSGSGKSTVARALMAMLLAEGGRSVTLLDGDLVRTHLSKGLGFSREDRATNVERIGWVASEVTKHGGLAICAPIAPYEASRAKVRHMVSSNGGFVLVHVATPLEVCEARDRKGLYAKARQGLITEFTGISDPYEAPTDAEIVLDTVRSTPEEAAAQVLAVLRRDGYLRAMGNDGEVPAG